MIRPDRIQKVSNAVADLRPEIVESLQNLVRIPSQTGDEGAAQEYVAGQMRAHGFSIDVWEPDRTELEPFSEIVTIGPGFSGRPNVVGTRKGRGGGRSLILNGHIDTVEPGDPLAWETPAFSGTIVDGRIYGRGACDMKGGVVANLYALVALEAAGIDLAGDVFLESTVSEEDGGAGALSAVLRGYTADGALISEPTNLDVIVAQGGSMMFRLHVPGLSAHACVRDEGVSAIEKFAYLHAGLLSFESRHNREIRHPLYADLVNKAPLNVGKLSAGSWQSSVPEWLIAEGRAGMVPGEDHVEYMRTFEAEIETLASSDPWLSEHPPTIEWLPGSFHPAETSPESPLVTTLLAAAGAVTGNSPRLAGVTYGADMRHFVLAGNTPCVMFGAGDVRDAHAPNESISIDDLLVAVTTTAVFAADWCSADG